MNECPCGSRKYYADCCGRYLDKNDVPPTAEALMRSRYTAYTRKNREYLLRTWLQQTRPETASLTLEEDITWTGLQILAVDKGGPADEKGMVEFVASYIHSGTPKSMREKSRFVRQGNIWFYLDGEEHSKKISGKSKTGRNSFCPCGSGKKYKKCCLQHS